MKKILLSSVALLTGLSIVTNSLLVKAQTSVHTVQSGEYLYSIARAYGVTVEDLRAWNGLGSDMVYVGDQLIVDGSAAGNQDTNTDNEATSSTDSTSTTSNTGTSNAGTYVVQPGDVLVNIAARFGVSVENLIAWNGLSSDWLQVGDVLLVSGDTSASQSLPSTSTPSPSTTGYHTVQAGDTLYDIANTYGVTVEDLRAWNGVNADWLQIGDVLAVGPNGSNSYTSSSVTSNTSSSVQADGSYTVQAGDTLQGIAIAHGMTLADLMAVNGLTTYDLQVGTILSVANAASSTSSDTSSNQTSDQANTQSQADAARVTDEERQNGVKAKHIVQEGDNLYRLANRYGVTVHNLKQWNNLLDDSLIQVGDILIIREGVYQARRHTVVAEDTLDSLAAQYNTTADFIKAWNKLDADTLEVGTSLYVSDPEVILHKVVAGENLESLAEKYKVSVEDIRTWNNLPANTTLVNGTLVVSNPAGQKEKVSATSQETSSQDETTSASN